MGKSTLAISVVVAVLVAIATVPRTSAAPADVTQMTGCNVQDAAGTTMFVQDCLVVYVTKTNDDRTVTVVSYQDKAQLPADAVLPVSAIRGTSIIPAGDFAGTYEFVLTPDGQYSSHGPIQQTASASSRRGR